VTFSPQNVDRLVSVYKAARQTNRCLLLDVYSAMVMAELEGWKLPCPGRSWPNLGAWYPRRVCRWLERLGQGPALERFRSYGRSRAAIAREPGWYILLFRPTMVEDLDHLGQGTDPILVYSMWSGYLDQPEWQGALALLGPGRFHHVHTSGHASLADLQRTVATIQPQRVIPVHTARPDLFETLFPGVHRLGNGERLVIE
jgi:ribonuclease J